ncbi:MAG: hypothetical protein R2761_28110 [Acidimicrobiales bacterium]
MLRHRPSTPFGPAGNRPPHGPGECLVLAAWLLMLAAGTTAVAWLLVSTLT